MDDVIIKRFESPDEVREFTKGRFEVVTIGGMTIGRVDGDTVRDRSGMSIGRVESDGTIRDRSGMTIGRVESDGTLRGRSGMTVGRIDRDGNARWECTLSTLGGIARTPMFLPPMPGSLLILSEDGRAWLVDASDGGVDGPREIGSALVEVSKK